VYRLHALRLRMILNGLLHDRGAGLSDSGLLRDGDLVPVVAVSVEEVVGRVVGDRVGLERLVVGRKLGILPGLHPVSGRGTLWRTRKGRLGDDSQGFGRHEVDVARRTEIPVLSLDNSKLIGDRGPDDLDVAEELRDPRLGIPFLVAGAKLSTHF